MEKGTGGFANPEKILRDLDIIRPGMRVADFGCGAGYFAIPLARLAGQDGAVFATDILESALSLVSARAKHEGLFQIRTILCDLEKPASTGLKAESVAIVTVANILYQAEDKIAILKEAYRILRKGGKLIVMEWKEDIPLGPPHQQRIPHPQAQSLAQKTGFSFEREFPAGATHYGFLFTK